MQINVKLLDLCGIQSYEFQQKKPIFKFSLRIKLNLNKISVGGCQTGKIKNFAIIPQRASLMVQLVKIRLQCGRPGFDPWIGKIPWRRERRPTPVFWPGEFHGLYGPLGSQRVKHNRAAFTHIQSLKNRPTKLPFFFLVKYIMHIEV